MSRNKLFRNLIVFSIICFLIGVATLPVTFSSASTTKSARENNGKINSIHESEFPATGFFYVEKKDGIWWFVTPEGEKFYSVGIAYVEPGDFYYGNISKWSEITQARLEEWGFNTLNAGNPHLFSNMSYICKLSFKQIVVEDGWTHRRIPDVFDQGWQNQVRSIINETTKILRNDSNLIGYQTDNEMKWGPDVVGDDTLLEVYMAANKTTSGKNKIVEFLRGRYENNIDDFNRVWKMNIDDFDDLFNHTSFGIKGWKIRSGRAKEDIDSFSRLIAETYFNFTNSALKKADPNHLNLGVRFFSHGVPRAVLEECGKYVDVISINYYRMNVITYDPLIYIYSKLFDCVTLDNWMYNYHVITSKPLLSSEYTFPGKDVIWPIIPKTEMLHRDIIISARYAYTQNGRADLFEWYAKKCLKMPYMVGHTWFRYRDKLNVVNWGLVNLWDEPYELLVKRMATINNNAIEIHENATKLSRVKRASETSFQFAVKPKHFSNFMKEQSITFIQDAETAYSNIKIETYPSYYNNKVSDYISKNNTLYVGGSGPGNFTLIQDAIDNASDGDIVYVYNGTYNELLYIDKSITLLGEDRNETIIIGNYDVVDVDYEDVVITISADNVKILGFTVTGDGGYFGDYILRTCSGVSIDEYDNCTIEGNILENLGSYGIRIRQSDNNKIIGNIILTVLNKKGCNIFIDSSNNTCIENNSLYVSTICGIWASRCTGTNIQDNIVSHSFYCGIILETSNNTNIHRNIIEENKHTGLLLRNSNSNIITSNNFKKEINRRQAFFSNSFNNDWKGNYWGRCRALPKCIFGKNGNNGFTPAFNFDWHPAQEPYEINWAAEDLLV